MGVVYRARHVKFGRPFAIKVLHKSLTSNPKIVRRFEREAELAGRLRHTNVASVIDVGVSDDGMHFMAMELAPGVNLAALLDEGPISEARMLDLAKQMCSGLQHAHDHGLIHRDFKPHNVLVEQLAGGREVARIVDWGVAILREDAGDVDTDDRLTTRGIVVGTPHYMAPEQARGCAIDHRVDLFALGLICYEMLTGKMPFEGIGVEVARANLYDPMPRMRDRAPGVQVDPVLEAIVRRLLEKERDDRPASGNAARELFELYERDRASCAVLLGVELTSDGAAGGEAVSDDLAIGGPLIVGDTSTSARDSEHNPSDGELIPSDGIARDPERDRDTDQLHTSSARRQIAIIVAVAASALVLLLWFGLRGSDRVASTSVAQNAKLTVEHIALDVTDAAVVELPIVVEPADVVVEPSDVVAEPSDVVVEPRDVLGPNRLVAAQLLVTTPGAPAQRGSGGTSAHAGARAPTRVEPPSAAEVATLYGVLGRELKATETAKGMEATIDLWPRYRWIRINEWITTPERRTHVARLLERLHADLRAIRQSSSH
jgi:serine/threonine protein kinase